MEELEEMKQGLISKIQDVSEEHDQPLFKELVTQYLQEKMKTLPVESDSDEDEDEDKDDDEETKHEDPKNDDDDDDEGQDPRSGKDSKPVQDKENDSESDEPPPSKYQGGFRKEINLHRSGDKSGISKGKSHADLSPGLEEVLHETEQIHYWKSLAIKQMFGRWYL